MPLLIDRSCPEWQKRNREHRRIANVATVVLFAFIIGVAIAVDHFFPPVVSDTAEAVDSD